jgi:GNAT superfamily N-acetyltransferase
MEPRHELTDNPPPDTFQKMWSPLLEYNERAVGNAKSRTLAILLKDTAAEVIGGLWGRSLWGSLFIDIMFVPEVMRRNGVGTALMRQAEEEAIRRACRDIWTETYAFQARPFYEKLGFVVFGCLDGPAPIFPRFFLKKQLSSSGSIQPPPGPPP